MQTCLLRYNYSIITSPWPCVSAGFAYFVIQHYDSIVPQLISESGTDELQSYGSACSLLESGLAETLTVLLDWRGNIVAVNLAVRSQEAPFKVRNTLHYAA